MVESKSINPPLNLKVGYFLYNHFKKKGNEQVWLGFSPSDISIVNVSRNRSDVIVDLADGTQYSILSKNSKIIPSDN